MTLLVLDIGGSAVKYALWEKDHLSQQGKVMTPASKKEFFLFLEAKLAYFQQTSEIEGIAVSCPGEVNEQLGAIIGFSFVPYLHVGFFLTELKAAFNLPITMYNDAKCVALAEYALGVGQKQANYLYVVMGTGVGTAFVNELGEIGQLPAKKKKLEIFLAESIKSLSNSTISMVQMSKKIAKKNPEKELVFDGKTILEQAEKGNEQLKADLDEMYTNLARVLVILDMAYNPRGIVIGGGVTANQHYFNNIVKKVDELVATQQDQFAKYQRLFGKNRNQQEPVIQAPQLLKCKFKAQANLIGAAKYFEGKQH